MREHIINTMKSLYEMKVHEHKLNIDIMLANPTAIPEHESFVAAIDKELEMMATANDKLETLKQYF